VGRSKEWGEEQFQAYNTAHYHQPSDEYSDTWDFRGMLQEAEIAMAIGRRIADMEQMPRFNPGMTLQKRKEGKRRAGAKISIFHFSFVIFHFPLMRVGEGASKETLVN